MEDPAPDCFTVERPAPGVFHVRHYAGQDANTPCCQVSIETSAADRAAAAAEGLDIEIVTPRRCGAAIDRKHEERAA